MRVMLDARDDSSLKEELDVIEVIDIYHDRDDGTITIVPADRTCSDIIMRNIPDWEISNLLVEVMKKGYVDLSKYTNWDYSEE